MKNRHLTKETGYKIYKEDEYSHIFVKIQSIVKGFWDGAHNSI